MTAAIRNESSTHKIDVRVVAKPMGERRECGPHLGDLRTFLAACQDLPDDVLVNIEPGSLDEGGRRNVTIRCTVSRPVES